MERITEPIIDRETGEITGYRLKNTEIDRMKAYRKLGELEDLEEKGELFRKWIPCSERLPEVRKNCLVTVRYFGFLGMYGFDVKTGHVETDGEWWGDCMGGEVTAWMPLPGPMKIMEKKNKGE